jgi:sulfide:quinone oxidoreductase
MLRHITCFRSLLIGPRLPAQQGLRLLPACSRAQAFSSSSGSGTAASSSKHDVVVVGGGAAGLAVSHQLLREMNGLDLAILEPSDKHYYQPGWTMVGGGIFDKTETEREEAELIPKGARWIKSAAAKFVPEENAIVTADGHTVHYNYLVVCPGIQINWDNVKGLREALSKDGVCSNYSYEHVDATWRFVKQFSGGKTLFTHPATPIKCGGAPQKVMYLSEDYWQKHGIKADMHFYSGGPGIFASPYYGKTLTKICQERGINTHFKHSLVEIKGSNREAVFKDLEGDKLVTVPYDFIHVTPPMGPPDVVKSSPLADAAGWIDVDKHTLRHKKYPNVFGLGDASNLPTSKTAAAVSSQATVATANLLTVLRDSNATLPQSYSGYTSCPLVTGYGKLVLAEFDYSLGPCETFPVDQSQERKSMYYLKKDVMPFMYWNGLVKGRWRGPNGHAATRLLKGLGSKPQSQEASSK